MSQSLLVLVYLMS